MQTQVPYREQSEATIHDPYSTQKGSGGQRPPISPLVGTSPEEEPKRRTIRPSHFLTYKRLAGTTSLPAESQTENEEQDPYLLPLAALLKDYPYREPLGTLFEPLTWGEIL